VVRFPPETSGSGENGMDGAERKGRNMLYAMVGSLFIGWCVHAVAFMGAWVGVSLRRDTSNLSCMYSVVGGGGKAFVAWPVQIRR